VLFVLAVLLAIFVLPSPWGIVAVVAAFLVEIAESAVLLKWSRRRKARVGAETFVGRTAVALSPLGPGGQVRVAGEIWSARSASAVARGEEVVVQGVDGLTLVVEPARK
jgi:membrane-bound serine protease (ClpP class)